jgi:putative addiction module component (TIGR02574 family)
MASPLRALEAAALSLPAAQREELARRLLASLDSDPGVEANWDKEIIRRVAAFEAGRYDEIPAEDVLAAVRERLKS